jgi:hypothetical protein
MVAVSVRRTIIDWRVDFASERSGRERFRAAPFLMTTSVYGLGAMDYVMILAFPILLLIYGLSRAVPAPKVATSKKA